MTWFHINAVTLPSVKSTFSIFLPQISPETFDRFQAWSAFRSSLLTAYQSDFNRIYSDGSRGGATTLYLGGSRQGQKTKQGWQNTREDGHYKWKDKKLCISKRFIIVILFFLISAVFKEACIDDLLIFLNIDTNIHSKRGEGKSGAKFFFPLCPWMDLQGWTCSKE